MTEDKSIEASGTSGGMSDGGEVKALLEAGTAATPAGGGVQVEVGVTGEATGMEGGVVVDGACLHG